MQSDYSDNVVGFSWKIRKSIKATDILNIGGFEFSSDMD